MEVKTGRCSTIALLSVITEEGTWQIKRSSKISISLPEGTWQALAGETIDVDMRIGSRQFGSAANCHVSDLTNRCKLHRDCYNYYTSHISFMPKSKQFQIDIY